jgi:predicted O-methyltransferase YrrM
VHLEGQANFRVYNKDTNTPKPWDRGMFVCTKKHLKTATPTQMRSNVDNPFSITYLTQNNERIEDLGWHFSWMGGQKNREVKLKSFCHYSDKFSFLNNKSYQDLIVSKELNEGDISPSGEINTFLKSYSLDKLPKELINNKKLLAYFLDQDIVNNFYIDIEKEYEQLCQIPSDINEHLPVLYNLANTCQHVTEMGVRTGLSTKAFLRTNTTLRSYDFENNTDIESLFLKAKQVGKDVDYIIANVLDIEIEETDLLFIDTWHTYDQLKLELKKHAHRVKSYIVFHDTQSFGTVGECAYNNNKGYLGILPAIIEFLIQYPEWKFKKHYTNNNGLTIIERCPKI